MEKKALEGSSIGYELPRYKMPENASCTFAILRSMSTWNSDTRAYVSTLLTNRETHALFVITSIKLHLTA